MGFLISLGTVLIPPLALLFGLAAFTNPITALIYVGIIVAISVYAIRRHERHHQREKYNDQNWR